jgi:hypothetical protein
MSWQQPQDSPRPQDPQPPQVPQWAAAPQQSESQQWGASTVQQPYQQPVAPPPFYTPHPYERRRSRRGARRRLVFLAVLVVIASAFWGYHHYTGQVAATSLTSGECFNGMTLADRDVSTVNSVVCTDAHSAQVLGIVTMKDSSYPGDAALHAEAQNGCTPYWNTLPATGIPGDAQATYILPDPGAFGNGVRSIDCLLQSPTEDLTKSFVH